MSKPTEHFLPNDWVTRPISPTCDCSWASRDVSWASRDVCGNPTTFAIKSSLGGWWAMCDQHGYLYMQRHGPYNVESAVDLIRNGEKWEGL